MKTFPRPVDLASARARRRETATPFDFNESRPDSDRVAQRAYDGYDARGREDGRDTDDGFEAEREPQGATRRACSRSIGSSGDIDGLNRRVIQHTAVHHAPES